MTDSITVELLTADSPTINGRIYPKEVLEQAIKNKNSGAVVFGKSDSFDLTTVFATYKLNLENDKLSATITPMKKIAIDVPDVELEYHFAGVGCVTDGKVSDFQINYLYAKIKT